MNINKIAKLALTVKNWLKAREMIVCIFQLKSLCQRKSRANLCEQNVRLYVPISLLIVCQSLPFYYDISKLTGDYSSSQSVKIY